jgi:hypothetical protein
MSSPHNCMQHVVLLVMGPTEPDEVDAEKGGGAGKTQQHSQKVP